MILMPHMLMGAVIGSFIGPPILAVFLAVLSHYFLDILPHNEYSIKNISGKNWKNAAPDFFRVILDFTSGMFLIFIFSGNTLMAFVAAFFAILPDGFSVLNYFFKNKTLALHSNFHQKKLHFLKGKKISGFWRIFIQVLVVAISILFLRVSF